MMDNGQIPEIMIGTHDPYYPRSWAWIRRLQSQVHQMEAALEKIDSITGGDLGRSVVDAGGKLSMMQDGLVVTCDCDNPEHEVRRITATLDGRQVFDREVGTVYGRASFLTVAPDVREWKWIGGLHGTKEV